jgi:hypothetical protein
MKTKLEVSTITRDELKNILLTVNTPMFISIKSNTEVKMRKKNNPYHGTRRISEKYKILTGFDYDQSIDGRQEKEGVEKIDTNPTDRPQWFEQLSKGLVTDKKTGEKFYLRYQYMTDSILSSKLVPEINPLDKPIFDSFVIQSSNYDNQGLENPLRFQVCDLRNIEEISIMGNHYKLLDPLETTNFDEVE